ncbi:hypothetical protein BDU57DRAFT_587443 [Ampelomyces quisqualis]|uniref:AAA+ ATPase domain-containing protein n=1 Tax=Ampelomyces quisqualis TaxID=50730 RepID=A0A6A5QL21_AMPQU|nr:hypothetical protein BDU57DRAFT_587443 [Ampelomyces quisqualis]
MEDISNGVSHASLDSKSTSDAGGAHQGATKYERGMRIGSKQLYSGKEDKRGRFQWQDEIPEDAGEKVENDETAEWVLVVRNVKVFNDPRKVLEIHSISVQSPLLKTFLASVLEGYPGVTSALQTAIAKLGHETEDERTTKIHARLLQDVLVKEFKGLVDISEDMKRKRVMTFELLWTLFPPGALVYALQDGQERAMTLVKSHYDVHEETGSPILQVACKFIHWDGCRFGTRKLHIRIPEYVGTRPIRSLEVYPLEYHEDPVALKDRLIARGAKTEELAGLEYRAYEGMAWRINAMENKEKYNITGRIVLDTYGWNRQDPRHAIWVAPLKQPKSALPGNGNGHDHVDEGFDNNNPKGFESVFDQYEEDYMEDGEMPFNSFGDGAKADARMPLTPEQQLICSGILCGWSLKRKLWLYFFVNCIKDIEWQKNAFDRLCKHRGMFDDVIEGKGRGMIILLCGPPGVGKTLTAESVAEEMKIPFHLQDILELCSRWNAILLLDDADVFLETRSLHDLQRNKLVSIFLRVLEYYEGTMFLTTNRVQTFDPAFQSRIHISLGYQDLTIESRKTIWENFLNSSVQEHSITTEQLTELARMNVNGRQIKNILKIARLMASRDEGKLSLGHILETLEVTQHLHNETLATDWERASMYE